jgi:hypothetical protein
VGCAAQISRWAVNPKTINIFSELWSVLDTGTGTITIPQLIWLLRHLPVPLGAPTLDGAKARVRSMLLVRDRIGRLPFQLTLFEVMHSAVSSPLPGDLRFVRAHSLKSRIFFARNPIDGLALLRALRDMFSVAHLFTQDDVDDCDASRTSFQSDESTGSSKQ